MSTGNRSTVIGALHSGKRVDPYLVWAELTAYRDYGSPAPDDLLAVAVQCRGSVSNLVGAVATSQLRAEISGLYLSPFLLDPKAVTFCSVMIAVRDVAALTALVERLELGTAVDLNHRFGPGVEGQPAGDIFSFPDLEAGSIKRHNVIGIIDDFVPFAQRRLLHLNSGAVRFTHVWSQDDEIPRKGAMPRWKPLTGLSYGYELAVRDYTSGGGTVEQLTSAYPPVLRRTSHGAHVVDIAAGPEPYRSDTPLWGAQKADLIAVHLPKRTVADSSGGSLSVQALDAMRYILHRAGPNANVVVNLSYGTMAGPHDGTSLLELAMEELIAMRGGRLSIIVPSGNAYEAACHARFDLSMANPKRSLSWLVPPDCKAPSYVEFWWDGSDVWNLSISVTTPSGQSIAVSNRGSVALEPGVPPQRAAYGVVFPTSAANAASGTMILVAVAPTATFHDDEVRAQAGVWKLEVKLLGPAKSTSVHAWIERDDTVHGQPRRGRQSRFVDPEYERYGRHPGQPEDRDKAYVQRHGSFNTIATGASTIVAGGFVSKGVEIAAYSGAGPVRSNKQGPDALASTEDSRAQPGVRAAAINGVDTVRMNGTSVAAPQVTRWLTHCGVEYGAAPFPPAEIRDGLAVISTIIPRPPTAGGTSRPPPDWNRQGSGHIPPHK